MAAFLLLPGYSPDWKTWQVLTRSCRGSSHNRGRNRGRIENSWGRDEKKMGNGLPLGQLSHLGTRIGLRRVSQHPGSGQNFVCPENLVELPATFCRLGYSHHPVNWPPRLNIRTFHLAALQYVVILYPWVKWCLQPILEICYLSSSFKAHVTC